MNAINQPCHELKLIVLFFIQNPDNNQAFVDTMFQQKVGEFPRWIAAIFLSVPRHTGCSLQGRKDS